MGTTTDIVRNVHKLNHAAHKLGEQYYHSNPLITQKYGLLLSDNTKHPYEISYDIKDPFTIAAITGSSILMTGGTDVGKTTLAKLMMNAFFGKEETGWHRIDVDNDFGKDTLTDPDFGVIAEGKKMSEGFYNPAPWLKFPGLIADEINRGHAKVLAKLLHVFDKDASLPNGARIKIGVDTSNGSTYQFQVAAINEGSDYSGVFDIDKALRRRTTIEIPMDIFAPTPYDRLLIQKNARREIVYNNEENHLEEILQIYEDSGTRLPLHPLAELFVAYLEQFDYCKNSLTKTKGSVHAQGGSIHHVCTKPTDIAGVAGGEIGCEHLRALENEMCPYVRGLTPGVSKNLQYVARGFALVRATKFVEMMASWSEGKDSIPLNHKILQPELFSASLAKYVGSSQDRKQLAKDAVHKYIDTLEVEIPDIEAAAGFVGYSKIGIASSFVTKNYQGNRFEAVSSFLRSAKGKFEEGLLRDELKNLGKILSFEENIDLTTLQRYCNQENPWLLRAISPYLDRRPTVESANVFDLY